MMGRGGTARGDERLQRFLNPRSIAYVGGSQVIGPIRASQRAAYDGQLYVVNPLKDEVAGISCSKSFAELPEVPDAAVIGLSAERSIAAVSAACQAGCGGVVVMSSGFAELGTEAGRARQQQLVAAAGDMPLLGPNCMGLINQFSGAAVWGDDNHLERQHGPCAAIISQSGALMIGMTNVEQAFPLGYVVSIGNQAVTSAAELIDAVLQDERITAIGLYLEGINDAGPLGQACFKALQQGVPVVALKGGDNAAGAQVSMSHTASMVVERDLWEAFCRRYGVVEVSSPKALTETLKLLTVAGLPAGNHLSVVSYSGGLNGLVASKAEALGLCLPMPTADNQALLEARLPETVAVHNPMDLNIPYRDSRGGISMQDTSDVAKAITAFAEGVSDQLVFFIDVPRAGAASLDKVWCDSLEALIEVREKLGVPVSVAGIMPEGLPLDFRYHMHRHGIAALCGYADVMEALASSVQWAARRAVLLKQATPAALLPRVQPVGAQLLDEAAAKQALQACGLPTATFEAVAIIEAGAAADRMGYPVAVKVLSDTLAHKARVGGVRLNLHNRAEVDAAAQGIAVDVAAAAGGHAVSHVLVEQMIADTDKELIVGIKRHPALGLAMMIGLGGGQAEQIACFTTCLLPLAAQDLPDALSTLGITEHPAATAFMNTCSAIERYAVKQAGLLQTLDVNPVILTRDGQALAADALIVLGEQSSERYDG